MLTIPQSCRDCLGYQATVTSWRGEYTQPKLFRVDAEPCFRDSELRASVPDSGFRFPVVT